MASASTKYKKWPDEIEIGERSYKIKTDYRDQIEFGDILSDTTITDDERVMRLLSYFIDDFPEDGEKMVIGLCAFYMGLPYIEAARMINGAEKKEGPPQKKLFDFDFDAEVIKAGFMYAYGIDLVSIEYLHWQQFTALLGYLPEDTEYQQRVSYRNMNLAEIKDKEERKRILKIQKKIRIPEPPPTDGDIGGLLW